MPDSPTSQPKEFVCDAEWGRSACAGEPFYKGHEGKGYCVLHFPGKEKSADFKAALQRKLKNKDFNFRGVWFPDEVSFFSLELSKRTDFSFATFNAEANFSETTFSAEAVFTLARFSAEADFSRATFSATAGFYHSRFSAEAYFSAATFNAQADFSRATFNAGAYFSEATSSAEAYFLYTTFSAEADFRSATFKAEADFFSATFSAAAYFSYATFSTEAKFNEATFSAETEFNEATFSKVYFLGATFSAKAYFLGATFSAEADFRTATFSAKADFSAATFRAKAYFIEVTFSAKASFREATFNAGANFIDTTFSAEADFSLATFSAEADFNSATFADHLTFAGAAKHRGFTDTSRLDLQFARIGKPDRVSFHTVSLRPHWFVNIDARKFDFTNVNWGRPIINEEIGRLEKNHISSPHPLLAIACRNLAVNAEENRRYEEASKFRYMAMEARLKSWRGFAPWRLSWWYWLASGYGERVLQAFLVLLGIWFVAGLLYTRVGFVRWEPRLAVESDVAISKLDDVGAPLKFSRALSYSAGVMTFQRPDPKPATTVAQTIVLLETILGPVQAALLALAIRRKFMR